MFNKRKYSIFFFTGNKLIYLRMIGVYQIDIIHMTYSYYVRH